MTISRIHALEEILTQAPNDVTTHYMLGNEYFKAQMYERAVATFRRYLTLADDEGAVYRMLAQATRHRHRPMIEEYTQALEDFA